MYANKSTATHWPGIGNNYFSKGFLKPLDLLPPPVWHVFLTKLPTETCIIAKLV